jgi:hypothetical protein
MLYIYLQIIFIYANININPQKGHNVTDITEDISETGFGRTASTSGEKIAHWISVGTNPLFVALPLFAAVALHTAPDIQHGLLWWVVIALGFTVAPVLFIRKGVRQGRYTDTHVSKRSQRLLPLSFGLLCMGMVFAVLLWLAVPPVLLATVVASLVAVSISLLITSVLRFKISLHMVGSAGALTTCLLLFGPLLLLFAPLVVCIGWARWRVRAHTFIQAGVGTLLAIVVTLVVFWLLGAL